MKIIAEIPPGSSVKDAEKKASAVARAAVAVGLGVRIEKTVGPSRYMTLDEIVDLTGIASRTWQEWINAGRLTSFRPGGPRGRLLVEVDEFVRFMERCKNTAKRGVKKKEDLDRIIEAGRRRRKERDGKRV